MGHETLGPIPSWDAAPRNPGAHTIIGDWLWGQKKLGTVKYIYYSPNINYFPTRYIPFHDLSHNTIHGII